jgi:hypothetical protein
MGDQHRTIAAADVQELLARWWFNYDNGELDALPQLLTDDTVLRVRTDSGTTDYEEFVRAEVDGRDAVMAWQTQHRMDSPYPLRHNGTNVHLTGSDGDDVLFASYIYVTQVEGVLPVGVSSAVVTGAVRVEEDQLRISRMEVVLDMTPSVTYREVR